MHRSLQILPPKKIAAMHCAHVCGMHARQTRVYVCGVHENRHVYACGVKCMCVVWMHMKCVCAVCVCVVYIKKIHKYVRGVEKCQVRCTLRSSSSAS